MTSRRSVVFAEPVRTAIGTFGGSLKDVPAPNLGAAAISAAVARTTLRADEVETVVMGNVVQAGDQDESRPASVRPCRAASHNPGAHGQPGLRLRSTSHRLGSAGDCSRQHQCRGGGRHGEHGPAPYLVARARWGYRMGDGALYDSVLRDGLNDAFSDAHSGWHTEDLVEKYQVTREEQDRWALRSQQRFAAAQADGRFNSQIVPVEVPVRQVKGKKISHIAEGVCSPTRRTLAARERSSVNVDLQHTADQSRNATSGMGPHAHFAQQQSKSGYVSVGSVASELAEIARPSCPLYHQYRP